MRNQYKVLAEKYNLVSEGTPEWDIQPTDKWYKIFKARKLPYFKEFIYWLNNYFEEWARTEMFDHMDNVDDLLGHIFNYKYKYAGEYIDDEEDEEDSPSLQRLEIAERDTIEEVYDLAFLPWYEERRAVLNKDNPGIEMDI